jgi:hypothetical protein
MPCKCPVCTVHSGAVAVFPRWVDVAVSRFIRASQSDALELLRLMHIPVRIGHGYDDHEESTVVECLSNSQTAQNLGSTASLYNSVRSKVPQDTA